MPGLTSKRESGSGDQRWLASTHALRNAMTGHIADVSAFDDVKVTTSDANDPGYIPSGQFLNVVDESNLRPYSGGEGEVLGVLPTNQTVPVGTDEVHNIPFMTHGIINIAYVPGSPDVPTVGAEGFTFVGRAEAGEDDA